MNDPNDEKTTLTLLLTALAILIVTGISTLSAVNVGGRIHAGSIAAFETARDRHQRDHLYADADR